MKAFLSAKNLSPKFEQYWYISMTVHQYIYTNVDLNWVEFRSSSPASSVEWLFLSCLFCHSGLSSHPTCVIPPFWAFYHPAHIHLQSLTFPSFEHQTRACLPLGGVHKRMKTAENGPFTPFFWFFFKDGTILKVEITIIIYENVGCKEISWKIFRLNPPP